MSMHRPPLPPSVYPGTYFCWRLARLQGPSAAGRIEQIKDPNDRIGNRTRNLTVCSSCSGSMAPLFLTSALHAGERSAARLSRFTPGETYAYKYRVARKKIKARSWSKRPPTIQSFSQMSLLGTCCVVTYTSLYGGSIQGRYSSTPH
jgi:hypothetical protein